MARPIRAGLDWDDSGGWDLEPRWARDLEIDAIDGYVAVSYV